MKKRKTFKKIICGVISLSLIVSITSCGPTYYENYTLTPNEYLMGEYASGASEEIVETGDNVNNTPQLTMEDIQNMNNGQAMALYSNNGYISFLKGRYYQDKVASYEDAIKSLNGIASLLGLGAGSEFFALYGEIDKNGYSYYVFNQRYGETTVINGTLKVVVDPEGYTAGVSCSFTPNLGIQQSESIITPEQALEIVSQKYAQYNLTFYPEYTSQVVLPLWDVNYNAYVIYSNNPNVGDDNFDMMYLEHFVSTEGTFLTSAPVISPNTDGMNTYNTDEYFNGLEASSFTGDIILHDGTVKNITVPIAYNPADQKYYLCDIDRKIMVADFYSYFYEGALSFSASDDGITWDNNDLISYNSYIKAYDFYAAYNIKSVDGFETPLLVCVNYCDENHVPVNNACCYGIVKGWVCCCCSDANYCSEALDVVAHEYTHGVTRYSTSGFYYQNEAGAISEAYSDIMGNICEMSLGETSDTTQWLIGEMSGNPMRSMSSPNDFGQPVSLSDPFYVQPTNNPDPYTNDNGGVHINNSLISQMAYILSVNGMSYEEEANLWITSIELLTPLSGYKEVYGALIMSVEINGLDSRYKQIITDAFNDAQLLN